MDFYDAAAKRHMIRDFVPGPMPADVLERILSAGLKAPTNDHMRDWQFIVVDDPAVTKTLLTKIPKQISEEELDALVRDWNLADPCQQEMYRKAVPKQYRMLSEAACLVVPLFKQKTDLLHPKTISDLNGFASIWCCIENILLAAAAEAYACALRIPLGEEAAWAQKTLGFPADYTMPCFLAIGKPCQGAAPARQNPCTLTGHVHKNAW